MIVQTNSGSQLLCETVTPKSFTDASDNRVAANVEDEESPTHGIFDNLMRSSPPLQTVSPLQPFIQPVLCNQNTKLVAADNGQNNSTEYHESNDSYSSGSDLDVSVEEDDSDVRISRRPRNTSHRRKSRSRHGRSRKHSTSQASEQRKTSIITAGLSKASEFAQITMDTKTFDKQDAAHSADSNIVAEVEQKGNDCHATDKLVSTGPVSVAAQKKSVSCKSKNTEAKDYPPDKKHGQQNQLHLNPTAAANAQSAEDKLSNGPHDDVTRDLNDSRNNNLAGEKRRKNNKQRLDATCKCIVQ